MAHIHQVFDSDAHFSVDPIAKTLKNESSQKTTVIQKDHNSERFTFEIPRTIEGHDMSLCNDVKVHYINIDASTKQENKGVYAVDDLQISPEDEEVVICSWLVSGNATQLKGPLAFSISYSCVTDDLDYSLNTAAYKSISVAEGVYCGDYVAEEYADILVQWEKDLQNAVTDEQIQKAVNTYLDANPLEENDPTVPDWAKAASKPTYTAAEVGALPSSTQIPKALSDLTQDTAHRTVTDAEKAAWNGKSDFSGSYNDLTDKPTIPDAYTLPVATSATLGGVKPVAKTDDMTQAVGVDALGALFTIPGGGGSGSGSESSGVKAELVYSFTADGETMSAFDDLAIEDGCVYAVLIAVPYNQGNTATTPVVNIIVATDQAVTYRGFPVAYVAGLAAWRDEFTCEMFTRNGSNMRMLTNITTEAYNKQWKGTYSGDKIYIYSSTADVNIISGTTVEVYKLV